MACRRWETGTWDEEAPEHSVGNPQYGEVSFAFLRWNASKVRRKSSRGGAMSLEALGKSVSAWHDGFAPTTDDVLRALSQTAARLAKPGAYPTDNGKGESDVPAQPRS
jgi:hypothetical protein